MLSGEGSENSEKTTIGLVSKKTTLHLQHTCFVHFFGVVLHDYNVELPETSWLHVLWRKCRTSSCSFFFHCRIFSPWWPLTFIFPPPLQKFSCCSSDKKKSLLSFISRFRSLSLLFLVELCWPVAYFLFSFVSVFLCIPNLWTWQLI